MSEGVGQCGTLFSLRSDQGGGGGWGNNNRMSIRRP